MAKNYWQKKRREGKIIEMPQELTKNNRGQ